MLRFRLLTHQGSIAVPRRALCLRRPALAGEVKTALLAPTLAYIISCHMSFLFILFCKNSGLFVYSLSFILSSVGQSPTTPLDLECENVPLSQLTLLDSPCLHLELSSPDSATPPQQALPAKVHKRKSVQPGSSLFSLLHLVVPPLFSSPCTSPTHRYNISPVPIPVEKSLFLTELSSVTDFLSEIAYSLPVDFYSGQLSRPYSVFSPIT